MEARTHAFDIWSDDDGSQSIKSIRPVFDVTGMRVNAIHVIEWQIDQAAGNIPGSGDTFQQVPFETNGLSHRGSLIQTADFSRVSPLDYAGPTRHPRSSRQQPDQAKRAPGVLQAK